jgi:choline dehydrogenase-like flavoprotein
MKVDTIIVGSGVVATTLVEHLLDKNPDLSILVLEAGTRIRTMDFGMWENYVVNRSSAGLPYNPTYDLDYPDRDRTGENVSVGGTTMPLAQGRSMVFGGSTLVWGGWSFRLKPEDFFLKTNTGQVIDWPFDYNTLEPYYCRAEDQLAVSGDSHDPTVPRSKPYPFHEFPYTLEDQPIAQAMASIGVTFSHLPIARRGISKIPSRHAPCQTTGTCKYCPFGARYAACNYMDDLRAWNDYPNLEIRLGAVVMEIRMASKRRAAGLTYRDTASGQHISVDAERIIVAAGTIESAKLLLRSNSSYWPNGVGNGSDMVGRHLITHPYFVFKGQLPRNPLGLQPEMDFPTLVSRHFDSPEEQKAGKFILVNPPDTVPVSVGDMMKDGDTRGKIARTITGHQPLNLHSMLEVFGRFHNRVLNLPKLNHLGMPQTIVDYTQDKDFTNRLAQIQNHVRKIFKAMGGEMTSKPSISWRCDHAGSTCRMSKDPAQGVVDADLRVHGTDNLYVCSNAVFPTIGAINPTVTVTALALKLGDHLNAAG